MKKICFICHEYPPLINGGIGTFTKDLAESLTHRGFDVSVIGLYDINSYDISNINGVEIHRIPNSKGKLAFIMNRIRFKIKLESLIKNKGINIIEAPDFGGWLSFINTKEVKKIIRIHGSVKYFANELNVKYLKDEIWGWLEKKAFVTADIILSVSSYTGHKTKELFNLSVEPKVLHNSVNFFGKNTKYIVKKDCKRFIFVGTLVEKKGVINLLKAWNCFICESGVNDVKLTLVGKDPLGIVSQLQDKYFNENIEYLGAVCKDELINLYMQHDCAVFPSFSEAFALAPMEAMSIGIPVIYSSLSSGPELIESDVDGYLINPKNIEDLKNGLLKLYNSDVNDRENISINALSTIKNKFSYDDFIEKNINEYLNV
ncbi:glycosyltransferase family 4 protein [Photobacterium damselae]|uniref:glycosyltransferase family 4 protein n=1 Tax=Photobacterium damselae TaxID=38293 RepID=UPI002542B3D2